MSERILFVDDEPNVLTSYTRSLKSRYNVETALCGLEGLKVIADKGPFAVIVSDQRMVAMNGIEFLKKARALAPDSVRMMLTGHGDLDTAIAALNKGHVFRFLTKPCSPPELLEALEAGVKQYRLVRAEKELLQETLKGSVKIFADLLAVASPVAFGRASRARRLVCEIAQQVDAEMSWALEMGTLLSQVGCMTIPADILAKAYRCKALLPEEQRIFNTHPEVGGKLIENLPRLAPVAEIVAYQEKRFDGSGPPEGGLQGADIPLGARILKLALDYDALRASGYEDKESLKWIRKRNGWYDPDILQAFETILRKTPQAEVREVEVRRLEPGMVLVDGIQTRSGAAILPKGQELTAAACLGLNKLLDTDVRLLDSTRIITPVGANGTS